MIYPVDTSYLEEFKKNHVFKCELCKGIDYRCKCWNAYRLEFKKIKAYIPIKFRSIDLKQITHPQVQPSKKKIESYISQIDINKKFGNSLYLFGQKGLAKTVCGINVLIGALKRNYTAFYFESFADCVNSLVEGWYNKENDVDIMNIINSYDFIAIDDVGSNSNPFNANAEQAIKSAFKERSSNLLPTIFISNFSRKDINRTLEKEVLNMFSEKLESVEFKGLSYIKHVVNKSKND